MEGEGSDLLNAELLSLAMRQCDERLECNEHWIGRQALDKTKSDTVVKALKVIMLFYVCSLFRTLG